MNYRSKKEEKYSKGIFKKDTSIRRLFIILSLAILLVACDSEDVSDAQLDDIDKKVEEISNTINEITSESTDTSEEDQEASSEDTDLNEDFETEAEEVISEEAAAGEKPFSEYPLIKTRVVRVVDGDTIKVNLSKENESLRLIGMDTPESVHPKKEKNVPEGKIASDYVTDLIEGKDVYIEFDVEERDRYGRYLAYIYLENGEMLNDKLLKEGYAQLSTYPPNVRYVDRFKESARIARENNVGFYESSNVFDDNAAKTNTSKKESSGVDKVVDADGKIKGNVNSGIYHVPGGAFYDSVSEHNIVWFDTEKEAQAAGYKKAKR